MGLRNGEVEVEIVVEVEVKVKVVVARKIAAITKSTWCTGLGLTQGPLWMMFRNTNCHVIVIATKGSDR